MPEARETCADRFVIDELVSFDAAALATPAPTPSPTPFPFASPPPPPFETSACGPGPFSFVGWIASDELGLDRDVGADTVYAAITRDVIEIGSWIDDPAGSGERFRTMGQRVCFAAEWETGSMGFASMPGTAYREWEDGRRTPVEP